MLLDSDAIANYVAAHPGCTARDVAIDVLGGTGRTRTHLRQQAYQALVLLEAARVVTRVKGPTHSWYPVVEGEQPVLDPPTLVAVTMTASQLHLICHVFDRALEDGYIGNPLSRSLLEHLRREQRRLGLR